MSVNPVPRTKRAGKIEIYIGVVDGNYTRPQSWRWRLRGRNGKILCQGEDYTNFSDLVKAVKRVRELAAGAKVMDLTMPGRSPEGYFDA